MIRETRAITLIEMLAVIVVVGLAIPPIMLMWQNLAYNSGRSAAIALGTFYAQELMEEIRSKDFVDPDDLDNTALGPNGETYPNFDDVDDFDGYSEDPIPGTSYNRTVEVKYVYLDTGDYTWKDYTGPSSTDYKHIKVLVSRQLGDASLVTIVSKY